MNRRELQKSAGTGGFVRQVTLAAGAVVLLYPLAWLLGRSFDQRPPNADAGINPVPSTFTIEHFEAGWGALPVSFGQFILNSFVLAATCAIANMISCSLAAFVFGRLHFPLKRAGLALVMVSVMLPFHVTLIPQYIMFNGLGWTNSILPLIVPKLLAADGFFVFLGTQFVRALPVELDEASELDGCGPYGRFTRVILPLMLPALATTGALTFVWTWNDFLQQLVYLNDPSLYTVPIGLRAFLDVTSQSSYGSLFAMATLSLAPVVGFFIAAQRYIVDGIATTGQR